jgi:uncharacterized protein
VSPLAHAASFDCNARDLSDTRAMICSDVELSRVDERTARRVRGLQRRQGFGLYLSMRYWTFRFNEQRDTCGRDKACVLAMYRAQGQALDRLQGCLEGSLRKRACLRAVLGNEETASKSSAQKP